MRRMVTPKSWKKIITLVVVVPVNQYIFTNQSQPRIYLINQLQSTSCSPLIGPFKFQALSLVNTQKRTSGHAGENILFSLSLVNQKPLSLSLQPITVKPKPPLPSNHSKQTNLAVLIHPLTPRGRQDTLAMATILEKVALELSYF